jgi:hypothetical protein
MHWDEASLLELIVSKNSNFYPLKLDLCNYGLVLLVLVMVSWFSGFLVPTKTNGLTFLRIWPLEKSTQAAKICVRERHTSQDSFWSKIPLQ